MVMWIMCKLLQQWVVLNVVVNHRLRQNVKDFLADLLKDDYAAWDIRLDVN
jgi:hypothetical protein